MTRFLVVPQWQGSPAARAILLAGGAEAIAGDLPRSACTRIDVPVEAGDAQGTGIRRFSALARVRDAVTEALTGDEPALIVGGDCGVAVPGIAHAATRDPHVAVLWFDAHADLHSIGSSPSGAFAGMALRAAMGDGPLAAAGAVPADHVVLAGAREFDDPEAELIDAVGLRVVTAEDIAQPETIARAVAATGATSVYIHVDLDVLDPAVMTGVGLPTPFGAQPAELTAAIAAVRERLPLRGSSIAGFAPASPAAAVDDLGTILRIVGALA